MSKNALLR